MLLHHSHCSLLNDALQRKDALRHSYRFSRLNTASHRCAPPLPPITERPDESAMRLAPEASRDDRIVVIYYPILSCFWKMISVSDPNPVLVEIILSVSENYPKVHCVQCSLMVGLLHAMAFMVLLLIGWVIWNNKPLPLWCTTYIFVLCLFCLMRQNNFWSYFAFSWTWLVETVAWQVWNACPV